MEAGRVESQKLLLERYNRIEIEPEAHRDVGSALKPKFIKGNYQNYYNNLKQSNSSSVDQARQFIPMSQKGNRPIPQNN